LNILLIGSGPASYACLSKLIKNNNLKITLIDNSEIKNYKPSYKCTYDQKHFSTSRITNWDIFEQNQIDLENLITKNFGGLSTIWGSAVSEPLNKEIEEYIANNIDISKYLRNLNETQTFLSNEQGVYKKNITLPLSSDIKRLLIKIKNLKIFNATFSKFLINNRKSIDRSICSSCGSYRFLCENDSLWTTQHEITKLIKQNRINYLPNHKLISFKESKNNIFCNVKTNNEILEMKFDTLFIGAGAFATSELFINSGYVEKVEIENSDLCTVPFLKKSNTEPAKLSHPILFIDDIVKEKLIFSQIYFYSDNLLKIFFKSSLLSSFIIKLPNIIKNLFGGMRIFLDPKISSKIVLTKVGSEIQKEIKSMNSSSQKEYLDLFLTKFNKVGIFPLPIFRKTSVNGESYHFGGQFKPNNSIKENSTDLYGRIANLKNTYIIDSSVLPVVNTGPITYSVMANSQRISDHFLNNINNEFSNS
jgi:hypothetical protein